MISAMRHFFCSASVTSFRPSPRNRFDLLRFLRKASPRISLTIGFDTLVICLTWPEIRFSAGGRSFERSENLFPEFLSSDESSCVMVKPPNGCKAMSTACDCHLYCRRAQSGSGRTGHHPDPQMRFPSAPARRWSESLPCRQTDPASAHES